MLRRSYLLTNCLTVAVYAIWRRPQLATSGSTLRPRRKTRPRHVFAFPFTSKTPAIHRTENSLPGTRVHVQPGKSRQLAGSYLLLLQCSRSCALFFAALPLCSGARACQLLRRQTSTQEVLFVEPPQRTTIDLHTTRVYGCQQARPENAVLSYVQTVPLPAHIGMSLPPQRLVLWWTPFQITTSDRPLVTLVPTVNMWP